MDKSQLFEYDVKAQSSADLMEAALTWIRENPKAWETIVVASHQDSKYVRRVRIKSYIEGIRGNSMVNSSGVKLRNAYSAPFGRILAAWYPELKAHIPLNRSKVDGCVIPPMESILGR